MKIPFDIKYRPQIESGEYKVETRNGSPVRIICWDAKGCRPIIALIHSETDAEEEVTLQLCTNGKFSPDGAGTVYDLFIVTPEPELTDFEQEVSENIDSTERTEFEQELVNFFNERNTILPDKDGVYNKRDCEEFLHKSASKLLALAEKELSARYGISSDNGFAYKLGYKAGMEDALKERSRNITANLLDAKITGIQHELIQFASNILEAGWKDIIETADGYAKRIRAHVLKDLPRWIPNKFDKHNFETCKAYLDTPRYLCYQDKMIDVSDLVEKLPKEDEE